MNKCYISFFLGEVVNDFEHFLCICNQPKNARLTGSHFNHVQNPDPISMSLTQRREMERESLDI